MEYEYSLIRSSRKSLSMEISRELKITVRAPKRCPQRDIDIFIEKHASWLEKHLEIVRRRNESHPLPTEEERRELFQRARMEIPPRVSFYAEKMGLSPTAVTITGAEKRFGSCSPKNRLCFSYRLAQYSPEAVDYVVVHELAHIVHKNHGRDFYKLIESVLPDYKVRQRMIK